MTGPDNDTDEAAIGPEVKRSYNETLDRLGFFCDVCETETRNASGLVYFESKESAKCLRVCHNCLPDDYE